MEALYSSKQVTNVDVQIYDRNDEKYIREERFAAQIMISTQRERLKIRDYNNQFNRERK